MGLYTVSCSECKEFFLWFSGSRHQVCDKCMKEFDIKSSNLKAPGPKDEFVMISKDRMVKWLVAAVNDSNTSIEFKSDIEAWFQALHKAVEDKSF